MLWLLQRQCNDNQAAQNSSLQLPNYTPIHQIRNTGQRGGVLALHVHNSLDFTVSKKQSIISNDIDCACIKTIRKNIVSCNYQPPRGISHTPLNEIKTDICKNHEKPLFLVGDLNVNSSYYSINANSREFFNLIFQNGVFALVNRPKRVTKSSATIIDNALTNTIIDSEVQTGISDHFSALMKTSLLQSNIKNTFAKRDINEDSIKCFKSILNNVDWNLKHKHQHQIVHMIYF